MENKAESVISPVELIFRFISMILHFFLILILIYQERNIALMREASCWYYQKYRIFAHPNSQALNYDPSTNARKESDIRKPYYNYVIIKCTSAHVPMILLTFLMLFNLYQHLRMCRCRNDKMQICCSLITGDKTFSHLCHICWLLIIER